MDAEKPSSDDLFVTVSRKSSANKAKIVIKSISKLQDQWSRNEFIRDYVEITYILLLGALGD
jgi:hypothetical protein